MYSSDFFVILAMVATVAAIILGVIGGRRNWKKFIVSKITPKKKIKTYDKRQQNKPRYKPSYDGKIKVYRRGNRHH